MNYQQWTLFCIFVYIIADNGINSKCKILVLAPRVPVVEQNYERIRDYLGLDWEETVS